VKMRFSSLKDGIGLRAKGPNFRRIRWLAVLLPTLSVGLFEFLRHEWLASVLPAWLGTGWAGNVVGALVVAAVVYVFVDFFTKALQESALEVTRAREEAAVAVERQRIARETHDDIAQALFYLTAKLREAEDLVAAGKDEEARGELWTARKETKAAHHRVREVVADLREQAELEDFDEAVRRTTTEVAEQLGVRVTCEVVGQAVLPVATRQHALAIVQEALVNAHRHGHTRRAAVRLKTVGKDTTIEVSDDGIGFEPEAVLHGDGRYGLTIMEERAQMAGGRLDLDSAPGNGTRVTVRLPGIAT
jgi:signal transduction histidine kinase